MLLKFVFNKRDTKLSDIKFTYVDEWVNYSIINYHLTDKNNIWKI